MIQVIRTSDVAICFEKIYDQGSGVGGVACFQLESESVFKTVGVGFLKLLESGVRVVFFFKLHESESGVGTYVAITDSSYLIQGK